MHSQWEDITPAIAREALKTADCGRPPSASVVQRYSRDMQAGRWKKSPEPVVYDGEDSGIRVLRDGRQRYLSIIEAAMRLTEAGTIAHPDDFSITLWVTTGTTQEINEAFPYINTGKPRTGNDYLAMSGRKDPTLLYTVGRRIVLWEAGRITGNSYKPTRAEVLAILEPQEDQDPQAEAERIAYVEAATGFAANWKIKPPVVPAGVAGFLWWLLGRKSPEQRDVFLEYLRDGSGLTDEVPGHAHPLVVLRKRLARDQYEAQRHGTRVKQETVLYLCLNTWDAWRKGEKRTKLQMPEKLGDGSFKEPR
jgi:hypothetical protein